ncbi:hypothetical protein NLG97_g4104 [Lecanicillium saksenae]|uniref:Uncharacterized protein n=1 Tax=Lecanicillium saksenae TaxID=468837 RepID=A0ACC1QZE6_9HYPO|nr:hypothetical protein NLG97_g4104 [Lecanicillium saksenae]
MASANATAAADECSQLPKAQPLSLYLRQVYAKGGNVKFPYLKTSLFYDSPVEPPLRLGGQPGPRWGCPTYRTAYGDDGKFERYMKSLFTEVTKSLERDRCMELVRYMDWPVIEGARFDGLSSAGVRRRRSLESLDTRQPIVAVVEKNWEGIWHEVPKDKNYLEIYSEPFELIEGNPTEELGWWYLPLVYLVSEYNAMSRVSRGYNYDAPRPPDVYDFLFDRKYPKWRGDEEKGHHKETEPCTVPFRLVDD